MLAAYNDSAGVTAQFNLNMLRVLNRELGADFSEARFKHRASYDGILHRIEMHLVSEGAQTVCIPGGGVFYFADGETVRTERPHTPPGFQHAAQSVLPWPALKPGDVQWPDLRINLRPVAGLSRLSRIALSGSIRA